MPIAEGAPLQPSNRLRQTRVLLHAKPRSVAYRRRSNGNSRLLGRSGQRIITGGQRWINSQNQLFFTRMACWNPLTKLVFAGIIESIVLCHMAMHSPTEN